MLQCNFGGVFGRAAIARLGSIIQCRRRTLITWDAAAASAAANTRHATRRERKLIYCLPLKSFCNQLCVCVCVSRRVVRDRVVAVVAPVIRMNEDKRARAFGRPECSRASARTVVSGTEPCMQTHARRENHWRFRAEPISAGEG